MKWKQWIQNGSGIQKKYLKYTIILLAVALFLSYLGVGLCVRNRLTRSVIDKYQFMTERMGLSLDNLYQKSDEMTAECILYDDVQQSLKNQGLEEVNYISLSKYFAYVDLENIADYCYVDNKGNVYSRSYSSLSYEDVEASGFEKYLGDAYSRTVWFWAEDTLFGTGEEALFIGRYVRSMDYVHEPGMLFFKMGNAFLEEVTGMGRELTSEAAVGIVDGSGQLCLSSVPEEVSLGEERQKEIGDRIDETLEAGMFLEGERIRGGALSAYREENSGLVVFSYVPDSVLSKGLGPVFLVLTAIYILVILLAAVLSIYFSRRFTKPIQVIGKAMTEFDGSHFDRLIDLHTNTELDEIGHSYTEMLGNIQRLLEEIKAQERELRTTELNMLISQINPHFLYNTLEIIRNLVIMDPDIAGELIEKLVYILRYSVNSSYREVRLREDMDYINAYLYIQKLRFGDRFQCEICLPESCLECVVPKLLFQPLIENSIKYGYQDQMKLRVDITSELKSGILLISVCDNGPGVSEEKLKELSESLNIVDYHEKSLGLHNISRRLRLLYGEKSGVTVRNRVEGGFEVILAIDQNFIGNSGTGGTTDV